MKKKKIDFAKYAKMCEETTMKGKDGTEITVRNHISYADKIAMATELVENFVMTHDDSICYESYELPAARIYEVMKYYTDVPVDGAGVTEVADFAINNGLINGIREYIHDDYFEFEDVYITLVRSVMDNYEDDRSLKKAIRTSFGFLFNGEDITESLAKAEMTKDTMFKALDAINKKEQEEAEKINGGKLKVAGNILNFAKRE